MKKTNKKGFTIVELVIVIAVIAILAAVLIPTFSNVVNKAKDSANLQGARNLYTEILVEGEGTYKVAAVGSGTSITVGKTAIDVTKFVKGATNVVAVENGLITITADGRTVYITANGASLTNG